MTDNLSIHELTHELAADLNIGPTDIAKWQRVNVLLCELFAASQLYRTKGAAGAPSGRLKELDRVETHAQKLRDAITLGTRVQADQDFENVVRENPSIAILSYHLSKELNPEIDRDLSVAEDPKSQEWWRDFLQKLNTLQKITSSAISELKPKKATGRGGDRHQLDWARRETAWHLLRLYAEVTRRKPGVSNPPDGGQSTGPAVRFLTRCLNVFGWKITPGAASKLIREIEKDPDPPWAGVNMAESK